MGRVGGVGGMFTFLELAHYGCGGMGGVITFLRLAHILECGWWVGWVGGVGGMIPFLGLDHILECGRWIGWVGGGWDDEVPWTCTHTRVREVGRVGGWGGWDVHVPWTCTHNSLRMWRDGWGGIKTFLGLTHILGRCLQLRNCRYNSLASATTSFFAPYGLYSGLL